MSSPADNISVAQSELIIAQKKIEELEEALEVMHGLSGRQSLEIEGLKSRIKDLETLQRENMDLQCQVNYLRTARDRLEQLNANQTETIRSLNNQMGIYISNIEFTESKITALEKSVERLKQKPENLSFSNLVQAFKDLKKENQQMRDNAQFELDTKLSQIRQVLGAKDRTDDRPHETALNVAKRVMEELSELKSRHKFLKGFCDNLQKKYDYLENQKLGARIYTPPAGYILVKEDEFKKLVKEAIKETTLEAFA